LIASTSASYFLKLDLLGYYQVCIAEGDEQKTTTEYRQSYFFGHEEIKKSLQSPEILKILSWRTKEEPRN